MYLMGYDIGSSSIKATLLNPEDGSVAASATSPKKELPMKAVRPGWAEQDPAIWWDHVKAATAEIRETLSVSRLEVAAIGISYQMHGLVIVDREQRPLRDAIIWCDSRAVEFGQQAFEAIGPEVCLERLLNSPGNFTASKLKWVKENEPDNFAQVHKMMLPGDYIAMKLTGEIRTTPSSLSEGILWDYKEQDVASVVLEHYGFDRSVVPDVVQIFAPQGEISPAAADELGLATGAVVAYRSGDQPNNALSLNVLEPGEIAATAGTSGVVYGIDANGNYDPLSRVNTFVHVNHQQKRPRYGVLLCVNGTGILNSWLKHNVMANDQDYPQMNELAAQTPPGANGLVVLPYGNGAERTLSNRDIGASLHGLNLNIHHRGHLLRAGQEGIVFSLNYGLDIMREMGIEINTVRAGYANMFLSPLFASAFATLTDSTVELYNTDGSQGAARGAGLGAGIYKDTASMFAGLTSDKTIEPDKNDAPAYREAYEKWLNVLQEQLS